MEFGSGHFARGLSNDFSKARMLLGPFVWVLGEPGRHIANNFTYVHQIMTIEPSEKGFVSNGCGTWTNDLGDGRTTTNPFGDGMWLVNSEIRAGLWKNSDSSNGCYWERLSGFSGEFDDIIANDFTSSQSIANIVSSDTGFHSDDCGVWTYIGS
jgi:hypothetical protein